MRSEPPTGDELTRLLVSMKRNVLEQVAHEPVTAKRSNMTDRIIGLTLGVTLLLGIGAGAAFALGVVPPFRGDPGAAPASTATATPTATPTPPAPMEYAVVPGEPASRYGLACETLVGASAVSELFTTEVALADPIVTASGVGIAIPRQTSILSEGGTVCGWSNGAANNDQYGSNPDYVGVTVSIVPRPAEGWSEHAVANGMPSDFSGCGEILCSASAAVGDAWVAIEAVGGEPNAVDPSGWQPFVDAVIAAVSAAGPAAAPSTPERTGPPFPLDCDAIISLDAVRSITASPDAESYASGGGGWSEWAEARAHANNVGCSWALPGTDSVVASVSFVREGRWAFERMLRAGTASPLELAGLGPDDAVIRCDAAFGPSCAVDLRVGQDWFNVASHDEAAAEATATALAEAVLAQLAR